MRRRLIMVPFTHKPPPANVDKKLREKLRAEWPGILRWMIDGCLRWRDNGLSLPAIVQADTQNYFDGEDVFGQWADFQIESAKLETSKLSDTTLFTMWKCFAEQIGAEPGDKVWFNKKLRDRGYETKKSNGVTYFVRIKLTVVKPDTKPEPEPEETLI
jgi:putative DNA primase/helicase